jgi:hypothetical protein
LHVPTETIECRNERECVPGQIVQRERNERATNQERDKRDHQSVRRIDKKVEVLLRHAFPFGALSDAEQDGKRVAEQSDPDGRSGVSVFCEDLEV